jgi:hypothetical protein
MGYEHARMDRKTYRDGMSVINQQLNSSSMLSRRTLHLQPFGRFRSLSVELHQKERLVLDHGEKVVLSYQIEYLWSAKPQEVRKSFSGLFMCEVKLAKTFKK